MRYLSFLLLAALACGNTSGPQGKDPTVLIRNEGGTPQGPLTLTWYDQSGQVGTFTAAPGHTTCAKFTSTLPTDSVRYLAQAGDTTGEFHKEWSPWFDPMTGLPTASPEAYPDGAEYWMLTMPLDHYPGFTMRAVPAAPC